MKGDSPKTIYLKEYRPPDYLIDSVALTFELDDSATKVCAVCSIRKNDCVASSEQPPLVLDGQDLTLTSIALDGKPLLSDQYFVADETLTIPVVPEKFTLEIHTQINPQSNLSLEGLYKSSGNFCTQCEAEGFRKITYYLDRPDVMASFTTKIIADKDQYPVLLSNGNPIEQGELENNRHWVKWHDPFKKPSYLFALVAGKLEQIADKYTTKSGRIIDLKIYVEPENIDKCDHAMASLKKAMQWDEEQFGLEYDLDIFMIVAVNDFNMGAMENKGLNVFNSKYVLAKPETATDSDYDGIEAVIGHEYFHNWTGNRVTCRDWFQLSLKEGLTVYREQEFSADMGSRAVKRIQDVRLLRTTQFSEDAGPMAHPVRPSSYIEINNFYTSTVYNKGAEVVRLYRTLLGKTGFRKGLDLYFQRHDGQAVTTEDFLHAMSDANAADLAQLHVWYDQAGTPLVTVQSQYDSENKTYTLEFQQSCPATPNQPSKKPFLIPIEVGLLGRDGRALNLRLPGDPTNLAVSSKVLCLTEQKQTFQFINITEAPIPSLLRNFSAPVRLEVEYSEDDLAFLMSHDSDAFNSWEASQRLVIQTALRLIADYRNDKPLAVSDRFLSAFEHILVQRNHSSALLAETLILPSEKVIAEMQTTVDVDAIHAVREFIKSSIAAHLQDQFLYLYQQNRVKGGYSYDPDSIGQRSLCNVCLSYMMQVADPKTVDLCLEQFNRADNMTDVMAALAELSNYPGTQREQALGSFYDKWKQEPLVLDKWFALQACSKLPDTIERVKSLLLHTGFQIRNPNKVRALVGTFAFGNPVRFHDGSGSGYAFVADQILAIDKINPQIAARLLNAFSRWRHYDDARQKLMHEQLRRILDTQGLSKDSYEIASKSLN